MFIQDIFILKLVIKIILETTQKLENINEDLRTDVNSYKFIHMCSKSLESLSQYHLIIVEK
jgi:hypothetical protein